MFLTGTLYVVLSLVLKGIIGLRIRVILLTMLIVGFCDYGTMNFSHYWAHLLCSMVCVLFRLGVAFFSLLVVILLFCETRNDGLTSFIFALSVVFGFQVFVTIEMIYIWGMYNCVAFSIAADVFIVLGLSVLTDAPFDEESFMRSQKYCTAQSWVCVLLLIVDKGLLPLSLFYYSWLAIYCFIIQDVLALKKHCETRKGVHLNLPLFTPAIEDKALLFRVSALIANCVLLYAAYTSTYFHIRHCYLNLLVVITYGLSFVVFVIPSRFLQLPKKGSTVGEEVTLSLQAIPSDVLMNKILPFLPLCDLKSVALTSSAMRNQIVKAEWYWLSIANRLCLPTVKDGHSEEIGLPGNMEALVDSVKRSPNSELMNELKLIMCYALDTDLAKQAYNSQRLLEKLFRSSLLYSRNSRFASNIKSTLR